jgi:hypothetical protein
MVGGSLCLTCCHVREVISARGSRFLLCLKSQDDERYAKYPPQPVVRCAGFTKAEQQENVGQENRQIE